MNKLTDTPINQKITGLEKLLYELRQDLDIYCLISVNAGKINERGIGKFFFGHVQRLSHKSITLNIYKIFEKKKNFELNSIPGVLRHLITEAPTALDDAKLRDFIRKYQGPSDVGSPISALQLTIDGFWNKFKIDLDRFNTFRNKKVAHSEYGIIPIDMLPSYNVMESLFSFGSDFYSLISAAFIGVGPCDLWTGRRVKVGLRRLLQKLGLKVIKTDME